MARVGSVHTKHPICHFHNDHLRRQGLSGYPAGEPGAQDPKEKIRRMTRPVTILLFILSVAGVIAAWILFKAIAAFLVSLFIGIAWGVYIGDRNKMKGNSKF